MEAIAAQQQQQKARLHGLAAEVGALPCVAFAQIWTSCRPCTRSADRSVVLLKSEAQSSTRGDSDAVCRYAHACASEGVRAGQMELLGDCRLKGAIRLIEDLASVAPDQHPRDKLPDDDLPACSAIFLPVFDPADPLSRRRGSPDLVPCGLLEVLVCRSDRVRMVFNSSDLINDACQAMDKLQFAVSGDATAFKEWSRQIGGGRPGSPFASARPSPRSSLSRSSSLALLTPDSSDEALSGLGGARPAWPSPASRMSVCGPQGLVQLSS